MTELIVEEASKMGLMINTMKTEVMKFRCTAHNQREKFTYLGCEIRKDGNVRKVGAAFRTLSKV